MEDMPSTQVVEWIQTKFLSLDPDLNERSRRIWAAVESASLGRGGPSAVAAATGMSRNTIRAGVRELREGAKAAKADVVIAPSDIIGNILATATSSNEIVGAFLPGRFGGKNIAEFTITKEGLNNRDIEQVAPLLLINRAGESFPNKDKDFALETGDQIYVLADHNAIVKMRKLVQ